MGATGEEKVPSSANDEAAPLLSFKYVTPPLNFSCLACGLIVVTLR